jgi:hypothetical protein
MPTSPRRFRYLWIAYWAVPLLAAAIMGMTVLHEHLYHGPMTVTWTSGRTERLLLIELTGFHLMTVHDPSGMNLPLLSRYGPSLGGRVTNSCLTVHSDHWFLWRATAQAGGFQASTLTVHGLTVRGVWPAFVLIGLIVPVMWAERWAMAVHRDRFRRSRARFYIGGALAAACVLACLGLLVGWMTQKVEASWTRESWALALHSHLPSGGLQWTLHSATGPRCRLLAQDAPLPLRRGRWQWQQAGFGILIDDGLMFVSALPGAPEADVRPARTIQLITPYWPPMLLLLVWPLWWCTRSRRRWRSELWRHRGLCPTCGYDLRASKERCPECGSPVPV